MNKRITRKKLGQWMADQFSRAVPGKRRHKWHILAGDRAFRIRHGFSIQSIIYKEEEPEL